MKISLTVRFDKNRELENEKTNLGFDFDVPKSS